MRVAVIGIGGPQYARQNEAFAHGVMRGRSLECDVANAWRVQQTADAGTGSHQAICFRDAPHMLDAIRHHLERRG